MKKKIYIFFLFSLILYTSSSIFLANKKETKENLSNDINSEKTNSNIIENVNYVSKDSEGNEYMLNASEGEIDIKNTDVIFLKNVQAIIKLKNKDNIKITSDFGKYNILNNDTIFNENVIATYLDNKITSKYLDFSLERNTLLISKNVILTTKKNILNSDIIEMNIETKDTKILMHNNKDQVKIKPKTRWQ